MNERQEEIIGEVADQCVTELKSIVDDVGTLIDRGQWAEARKAIRENIPEKGREILEIIYDDSLTEDNQ